MNFEYCSGTAYMIKQGDTLYSLSRRYNVPLALILRANPYVDIYNLQIGDEICIPTGFNMEDNQPVSPGPGPFPFPTPSVPDINQPVSPGPGPFPFPTPSVPDINQPVSPGSGPFPFPTPSVPDINQPVSPGPGPFPFPTPSVPDINQPVSPGPGPMPFPTPSLPSSCASNQCPYYHLIAYVIRDNDSLQKILDYFNITLDDLFRFNNLKGIMLRPGMTIQIPKRTDD